ncbi:MAG: 6,7-dimethyl-8-ribityllumazine synthase [Chthonomonadales bacterium]
MGRMYEGRLIASGLRFGLVVSRWNSFITERMLAGAMDALVRHGASEEDADVVRVPGTWEIPVAAARMAQSGRYQAVVCIGCLIRGETPHFDYLAAEVTKGIAQVALQSGIPVTYGIITVENLEQAIDRAGAKAGNKGAEAAMAAIEMADLLRNME